MEYYGFAGNVLYVDLSSREVKKEPLDLEVAKRLIGGWGMNHWLVYHLMKPGINPFSPDNFILISAGVLVGTLPGAAKVQLETKSAAPGDIEETRYPIGSASGGSNHFGIMLKRAGFDHLVITGRADNPVYLKITDDEIEICNASDLWGRMDQYETTDELSRRHKGCGVWAIGRAGENKVVFSVGFVDGTSTLGRNLAAVAGSKNLKAIVVYGTNKIKVWNPKRFMAVKREVRQNITKLPYFKSQDPHYLRWGLGRKWAELYPTEIFGKTLIDRKACSGCALACRTSHMIPDGRFVGTTIKTPQFMDVPILGRRLELTDYREAMKLIALVDSLGLCLFTFVEISRFLAGLYRRGIIGPRQLNGLELRLGQIDVLIRLAEKIANREGIGNVIADGWYALSKELGVNAWQDPDGGSIVKGTSTLMDGRFMPIDPTRFANVVNPRGGHHLHPITYLSNMTIDRIKKYCADIAMSCDEISRIVTNEEFNTGRLEKHVEDAEAVYYSLGICTCYVYREIVNLDSLAELYSAATGIEMSGREIKNCGERAWNLYKLINAREGFSRADDIFPELWAMTIDNPIKTSKGEIRMRDYWGRTLTKSDLSKMLDDYYNERGWDSKRGMPTKQKVKELGLNGLLHTMVSDGKRDKSEDGPMDMAIKTEKLL